MAKKKKRKVASAPAKSPPPRTKIVVATRYDGARPSDDLRHYWDYADSKSVDASLDPETRRKLRNKARYEIANNSYAKGVALAVANAVVGSGPRLQVLQLEKERARDVEWAFAEWCSETRLAEKLRAMRFARFQDGESFALLCNNPRLRTEIKLDVAPFDAERVCADLLTFDANDVDGIRLDEYGNPLSYRVLTRHPGDASWSSGKFGGGSRRTASLREDAIVYPADSVIHWFRRECPEQHRGSPEISASLNLFALLRRYTLAVVAAAETAADFAAILFTDQTQCADSERPELYDEIPIQRGTLSVMPDGYRAEQLKAEQPATTYSDFKRELLGEIGRSLQIPVNLISGNSSGYNYASGRLDHQEYQKAIRLDQSACGIAVMRPIFRAWWREYALVKGLKGDARNVPTTVFYWDGFEHVDPTKEASAQATRLASRTTNLQIEYGKIGRDWEDEITQIAREQELLKKLGLTVEQAAPNGSKPGDDEEGE